MYFYFSKILAPFLNASNLLILLLIFFYFFRKKIKVFYFLFLFFITISLFPIGAILENYFLSKKFYNQNYSNEYDSILILSGDDERILHGLKLYKEKPNTKLIYSGGSGFIGSKENQSDINNFNILIKNLVNPKDLIILKESKNTIENIKNFISEKNRLNLKTTILVTSPYHYKRTIDIAKKFNLKFLIYYWPNKPRPETLFQYFQSIDVAENLYVFDRFIRELVGILSLKIFL